ncbi:tol-pal system protein YbgF [Luteimonas kalidii]|uniref:Cell division coordinator CpoB n=1 Tax=Luteimonas kalidii TaxID=3042025 RepID=A0ABT6JRG0_9GAMM|nr:tol-pal system protein YbgF [Luteimonas kalidii]MDH5833083.1 tol-pal system protein YbgF [Luteimonas kalidii]
MRAFIVPIAFAAALVAAAPAFAQRASLADRVAALELRAADNQGNVDLLNQLTALRSEVQALRSQIEELQQQNEQLRSTNRSQYLDLDGRLNRLEGGGTALPDPAGATSAAPAPTGPAAAAAGETPPTVHGDPGLLANSADERSAYDTAFDALKSGDYARSAELFQTFLQMHPEGVYAPNARYWLGESYYVTQNYELARDQFQALVARYPTHDKAPGALLKIGLSQYGLRDLDGAEATLAQVANQFPGTDAARTAEDRLHAIQLARATR